MIEVINVKIELRGYTLGNVLVRYHDIHIDCDLCMAKSQHLWIRMPQIWQKNGEKRQLVFWPEREISNAFQDTVLAQVMEKTGITDEKATEMLKEYHINKKDLTTPKNKDILAKKKNTRV